MVVLAEKPSFALASIWREAVVKGTGLVFVPSDFSTFETVKSAFLSFSRKDFTSSTVLNVAFKVVWKPKSPKTLKVNFPLIQSSCVTAPYINWLKEKL